MTPRRSTRRRRHVDVVIVGAGFAGLYMLHKLRELGFSAGVFEAGDDVGGTWYWNRYPGARCDVESIDYSYSLRRRARAGVEVDRALRHPAGDPRATSTTSPTASTCAATSSSRPGSTAATSTRRRSAGRHHRPRRRRLGALLRHGRRAACRRPKMPEIPGIETFRGRLVPHRATGRTRASTSPASGSASSGPGSSAIQSIPLIAEQAAELTVFQRTPNFSLPARNARSTRRRWPSSRPATASTASRPARSASACPTRSRRSRRSRSTDEEREATYEDGWEAGSLVGMLLAVQRPHHDRRPTTPSPSSCASGSGDRRRPRGRRDALRRPTTRSAPSGPASTPTTTRRSTGPTSRSSTSARPRSIEITETGIRTSEREYEFDAIVFATGFDAMTGSLRRSTSRPGRRAAGGQVGRRARAPTSAWPSPGSPTCS